MKTVIKKEDLLSHRKRFKFLTPSKKLIDKTLITKDANGNYKRKVTPYYFAKFIDSGVMDTSEILGDRRLEDLPDRLRLFFERMLLSRETIRLVLEAQQRGFDIDRILKEILYPNS